MENELLKRFGERVRQYRNSRGLSQQELANATDLHRNYISMVERGEKNISLINIIKLSIALRIDVEDLMKGLP